MLVALGGRTDRREGRREGERPRDAAVAAVVDVEAVAGTVFWERSVAEPGVGFRRERVRAREGPVEDMVGLWGVVIGLEGEIIEEARGVVSGV